MKKHTLSAVLLAAAGALVLSGQVAAADGKPAGDARHARVAGGERVALAVSRQSAEQWSAQRPKFRSLRPKARSNIE